MTLLRRALARTITKAPSTFQPVPSWLDGIPQPMALNYLEFAREGYGGNEIVFASIEEIATSASEPGFMVRQGKNWVHDHPVLSLLDSPNPFMDRYSFCAALLMYYHIAGNAYIYKIRSRSGRVVELWLLRPDRVRVIPDAQRFISGYQYWVGGGVTMGGTPVTLPVGDVIHWKTRHPYDDFYGLSPLKVIAPRIDTDNYIREFIKAYFVNAGVPGGILAVKQSLTDDQKREIKGRFRRDFGGPQGWHDLLIIDNNEAQFTATTAQLGQRGLVVPELDEINEARLAMPFGVPLSLIGARLGMSSSSYANRKSDREGFWDETLSPIYRALAGALTMGLRNEFTGIDEIASDLSQVRALQPDVDAVHTRILKDYQGGAIPLEYAQDELGIDPSRRSGLYLVPLNSVPTPSQVFEQALADGVQVPPPRVTERTQTDTAPGKDGTTGTPPPAEPVASSNGSKPSSNGNHA